MSDNEQTDTPIPPMAIITLIILFCVGVGAITTCSVEESATTLQRFEQRQQTIREVCGSTVDLKNDTVRATVCSELIRR